MTNKSTKAGEHQPNYTITPDVYLYALRKLRLKCGETSLHLERIERDIENRLISGHAFYEDRISDELAGAMAAALECYYRMRELAGSKIEFTI